MTRPIRIGIIDSGVNLAHPHVGGIAGGVNITQLGADDSCVDQLGHGTAIAALVHAGAPQAELFAVKIFQRSLATSLDTALRAIDWCISLDIDMINLSLGTTNQDHRSAFEHAVAHAHASGKLIVSAFEMSGVLVLPGCLPNVVAVTADDSKLAGECGVAFHNGKPVFSACPYAREIPGVPRERNLHGASFAVANITAMLASLCQSSANVLDASRILLNRVLQRSGSTHPEIAATNLDPNASARNRPDESVTSAHS